MAKFNFKNIAIKACAVVVGEELHEIEKEPFYYNDNEQYLERLKQTVGFNRRYIAKKETTACDLCYQAVLNLMNETKIDINSIDAIISVTQTPDYTMPGNAHVLHKKLKLNENCIALDLEFGCSGYIYGLLNAFSYIASGLKRILLVNGDTLSKVINKKDKAEVPIFGDAGCATIIEYDENAKESFFILKSNGDGLETMYRPAGGYRMPLSPETKQEQIDKDGNIRTLENFSMNGFDVFNFTLVKQPPMLKELLTYSNNTLDDVDCYIFHQANSYIVQSIAKRCKLPVEKVPNEVFGKYGNQNSVSIVSVICDEYKKRFEKQDKKVLLQGFGIGVSWGACVVNLDNIICDEIKIYKGENDE